MKVAAYQNIPTPEKDVPSPVRSCLWSNWLSAELEPVFAHWYRSAADTGCATTSGNQMHLWALVCLSHGSHGLNEVRQSAWWGQEAWLAGHTAVGQLPSTVWSRYKTRRRRCLRWTKWWIRTAAECEPGWARELEVVMRAPPDCSVSSGFRWN